jgi:hypothetical protein
MLFGIAPHSGRPIWPGGNINISAAIAGGDLRAAAKAVAVRKRRFGGAMPRHCTLRLLLIFGRRTSKLPAPNLQKFFGSFFQKRTACFCLAYTEGL